MSHTPMPFPRHPSGSADGPSKARARDVYSGATARAAATALVALIVKAVTDTRRGPVRSTEDPETRVTS